MFTFDRSVRRLALVAVSLAFLYCSFSLLASRQTTIKSTIAKIPIPGLPYDSADLINPSDDGRVEGPYVPIDTHPISRLMEEANKQFKAYDDQRSLTFKQTVKKYRRKYGRHPPPGFKAWYQRARELNVHNIDDFEQIMDDLRPFWGVEPRVIRMLAAHAWENEKDGCAVISVRNKKIAKENNGSWRSENLVTMIKPFVEHLPDMDIAMNKLDQPRVVVPWEDMQELLATEQATRRMPPEANNTFTKNLPNLLQIDLEPRNDNSTREDPKWFSGIARQFMDFAKTACPPESRANGASLSETEARYKDRSGGIITNFNLSSDLCTVGPEIQDLHGYLFSASSQLLTNRLFPVFGECKVNVNSDILFPANMYWMHDKRYDYKPTNDVDWDDKKDVMIWRGVTSGGVAVEKTWMNMHRQRLVLTLNSTEMDGEDVRILTEQPESKGDYENFRSFRPSLFAEKHTDVGFTEAWGCIPNCTYLYDQTFSYKPGITMSEQFQNKYLVDVDGHSFSGRWRAFLESKSLGFKATIFREWHDSRLFAWRHFVPMDNRYDDIYTLLTYFVGVGRPGEKKSQGEVYVARHDEEARRLAQQGREWASKVLRRDDIEVSCLKYSSTVSVLAHS